MTWAGKKVGGESMKYFRARNAILIFLMLLSSAIFIAACGMQDISDTVGKCCGTSALPIGAVGLALLVRFNKQD